jgi:CHAT domain-containing protein
MCLAGCASSTAEIAATAYKSRVASVVRYDEQYAKELAAQVEKLRSRASGGERSDMVSLLFALDELADIHAYRLVDFQKALGFNREAETVLASLGSHVDSHAQGTYFSHYRRLYTFIARIGPGWPPEKSADDAKERGGGGSARDLGSHVHSIYPDDFLEFVAKEDIKRVRQRIVDRKVLLERVIGSVDGSGDPESARKTIGEWGDLELDFWSVALESGLKEKEYDRAMQTLGKAWTIKGEMDERKWLSAVAAASQTALSAEARQTHPRARDRAVLRFRAGLASLRLGRIAEGTKLLDEMISAVADYDKEQKSLYDQMTNAVQKQRLFGHFMGLMAVFHLPAFLHAVEGESEHRISASLREQLYGSGAHGLKGFLNEHERLAFHHDLGYGYEQLGRRKEAIGQYKAAIEIIEKQRATIGGEEKRIQFLKDKEGVYKRLIPLLIEEGDLNGAFEYMERARSRAFVDMLAFARPKFGSEEETAQYQATIRALAEVEVLVQEGGLPRETAEQFHKKLRGGEAVQPAPKSTTPEFDSLAAVQTASMKEIGQALGKDAALLSFFVGDEKTTVMVLQDGQVTGWVKPISRAALVDRAGELRRLIEAPDQKKTKEGDIKEIERLGQALYRDLLQDTAQAIKKPVVYVVPHGPLHYLPFAAIHDGSKYLADRFTLLTVPSGTVLTYLEKKPSVAKGATVVFANPDLGDPRKDLPFAEREGAAIQARRPDAVLLKRNAALEARARKVAPGASLLHFASHATFDADRPLNSAVMLAPGEGDDGALTAGEIFGLRLPGSLVVLSGCETGMGKVASGDELIGLTRAFMYAGAPQLVATLWEVEDEATALLMEEFYKIMPAKPAAEALRQAQVSIRSRYPHPFYWAAFTTFGHHR